MAASLPFIRDSLRLGQSPRLGWRELAVPLTFLTPATHSQSNSPAFPFQSSFIHSMNNLDFKSLCTRHRIGQLIVTKTNIKSSPNYYNICATMEKSRSRERLMAFWPRWDLGTSLAFKQSPGRWGVPAFWAMATPCVKVGRNTAHFRDCKRPAGLGQTARSKVVPEEASHTGL